MTTTTTKCFAIEDDSKSFSGLEFSSHTTRTHYNINIEHTYSTQHTVLLTHSQFSIQTISFMIFCGFLFWSNKQKQDEYSIFQTNASSSSVEQTNIPAVNSLRMDCLTVLFSIWNLVQFLFHKLSMRIFWMNWQMKVYTVLLFTYTPFRCSSFSFDL